ncbi:MAG: ATP-binding cassette domain-containing protein [Ruminococcaceae bacterium]|nr:ATP-binding cassette domain-containing protein [Oscillospiraceae bacterium]
MIEVVGLTKKYGSNVAVNNISFSIEKGEIVGFLGPNGAGKSTTMNIISGYLSATSGSVKINGFDVLDDPLEARRCIGYLPELPPLYLDMTVNEYLRFVYNLKKVRHKGREMHISEVCHLVGIDHVRNRIVGNLSKGYKQRVGLAQALIGDPEVLILDEPTVGLDPNQIIEIRNMIRALGKERTIILSTHILPEVNAVCERVLMINGGNIVANDRTENITEQVASTKEYIARIEGAPETISALLRTIDGVRSVKVQKEGEPGAYDYLLSSDENADIRKTLVLELAKREIAVLSFQPVSASLEDAFSELTRNKKEDA